MYGVWVSRPDTRTTARLPEVEESLGDGAADDPQPVTNAPTKGWRAAAISAREKGDFMAPGWGTGAQSFRQEPRHYWTGLILVTLVMIFCVGRHPRVNPGLRAEPHRDPQLTMPACTGSAAMVVNGPPLSPWHASLVPSTTPAQASLSC